MDLAQTASLRLADQTETAVLTLWAQVAAGSATVAEFRQEASALIAAANVAGVTIADIGLAAEVTRQLGTPTGPVGLQPSPQQVDQGRIAAGLDTVLATNDPAKTLAGFVRSEPLLTVATAVQTGMARHGASGWVRATDSDPCKLCSGWADGRTRSVDTHMARHVGCACIQQPVFKT